jgi:hypothetical protein
MIIKSNNPVSRTRFETRHILDTRVILFIP